MAGTITPDVRHNTAYSFLSAQHYGLKVQTGVYTPSTGTTCYTSVGDAVTIPGIGTPVLVSFSAPKVNSLTGPSTESLVYQYDFVSKSVRWYGSSTGGGTLNEKTTALSCEGYTAQYVAIGWV